jgi:capsular exopolysaccharide synthesis family protein
MSRIFDALQRSGTEQSGIRYPDIISVVTEVFEAPQQKAAAEKFVIEPVATEPSPEIDMAGNPPLEFPSLETSIGTSSRLVFLTEPESLAAEKFRFLGVRLRQLQQTRPLKKLLVTSTIPEEGKSTVSANLAGVLARRKKQKVLLLEGDLRRPTLGEKMGLGKLAGVAEWLQSDLHAVSNVYRLDEPGFWFMPAGTPPANPLELMQFGRLTELMTLLAAYFDWIVVDSPPLLPLADTTVWSRVTDGMLLVVREGKTEKAQLKQGVEVLKKSQLLGVVLNGGTHPNHKNYYQRYTIGRK